MSKLSDISRLIGATIRDSDGNLRNVDDIIAELQPVFDGFDTHSMNEGALTLFGQKEMLGEVLAYLRRI